MLEFRGGRLEAYTVSSVSGVTQHSPSFSNSHIDVAGEQCRLAFLVLTATTCDRTWGWSIWRCEKRRPSKVKTPDWTGFCDSLSGSRIADCCIRYHFLSSFFSFRIENGMDVSVV